MAAPAKTNVPVPGLRSDLKISRQVMTERVSFVVKDPLKNTYFRFDEDEWGIISLFDGKRSLDQMKADYEQAHPGQIEIDTLKDYQKNLDSMNLLVKTKKEMNVLLVEKMKEMRHSQLLSKEGSLMYKRFPIVDPDKFFNKIIHKIKFFWTRGFFALAVICMAIFALIVIYRWAEFQNGLYEVFNFSTMSFWNLLFLWITIYLVIAVHELGHGLTCKFYGGEVHEIGFLLLFFQPCLYCNVNDAWLFDKKWKQVMVTVAGGFIEFWLGSLFAIVWAVTAPNTMINVLSFQVMTICSLSTIFANFNPLIKLDGYYLLADFFELPNLKDNSFSYIKHLCARHIFRLQEEDFEGTYREKRIYFVYGVLSLFWVTSMMLGLFALAKGFLIDRFHEVGVLISLWVAYKLFGGYMKKVSGFAKTWAVAKSGQLRSPEGKRKIIAGLAALLLVPFIPVPYGVTGSCTLNAGNTEVLRAKAQGVVENFEVPDGALIKNGQVVAHIQSASLGFDYGIAKLALEKMEIKRKAALRDNLPSQVGTARELAAKAEEFEKISQKKKDLSVRYETTKEGRLAVISCANQIKMVNTFIEEGAELCKVHDISELKAVVEIPEHQVRFVDLGNEVEFKVQSSPFNTYRGRIAHVRSLSKRDPGNPKAKLYIAEIVIDNPGELRPGMTGVAKIVSDKVFLAQFAGRKLASFFRMDLFF